MKWILKPILYLIYLLISLIFLYLCFVFLRSFYEIFVEGSGGLGSSGEYAVKTTWQAFKNLLRWRFHF